MFVWTPYFSNPFPVLVSTLSLPTPALWAFVIINSKENMDFDVGTKRVKVEEKLVVDLGGATRGYKPHPTLERDTVNNLLY